METKLTLKLNEVDKIKNFVDVAKTFEQDINLVRGSYVVDAKSILGIFSLDTSKPIDVEIITDDENIIKKFNEEMKAFM